jgi:hypothetical protein
MSSIVKGTIAHISAIGETRKGDPILTVTVYDNQRRLVEGEWKDIASTKYELTYSRGLAERIAASFHTGDAVLAEAENLTVSTYTTRDGGSGAAVKAWGIDIGLSPRVKAFDR